MWKDYHEYSVIWNELEWKQCQHIKKDDVLVQKLTLTQLTKWRQEQLDDDDDIGPILQAKEQNAQTGQADISEQSRELKILWAQWDSSTYQG